MKERVTLTLDRECVEYLDELASRQRRSRSAMLEALIKEHLKKKRDEELARLAKEFFAEPESPEEAEERVDWQKLAMEVLARNDEEESAPSR